MDWREKIVKHLLRRVETLLVEIEGHAEGSHHQRKRCIECADILETIKKYSVKNGIDMFLEWMSSRNELTEYYKWHLDVDKNHFPRYNLFDF